MLMIKFMLPKRKLAVVMLLISFSAAFIYILYKQTSFYPYRVNTDYNYNFQNTNAEISNLTLVNGQLKLPNYDSEAQSSFLKVNISSTLIGRYFQPSIKIISGNQSFIQYFEHGAKGVRYLNISSIPFSNEGKVEFQGKNILVDDQLVQLISFKNPNINKQKILFISPHPDDAEIAAFGFYSDNKESYVITITAGDAGGYKYASVYKDGPEHFLKKGELRTWNSLAVPQLGGISPERTLNLGFFDTTLVKMAREKDKVIGGLYTNTEDINTYRKQNSSRLSLGLSGSSNWNSLVENLSYLLKEIKPDIIVTPHPMLDSHPDHKFSTIALLHAINSSEIYPESLYLYTNHFSLNEYYPYGEIGGIISLPPNFSDKWNFDSIYSHSLSSDKQKDKIFALDAMNDLRPSTEWRFLKGTIKMSLRKVRNYFLKKETNYFDRSVRSNELFFVVKINKSNKKNIVEKLIETWQ